MTQRPAILVLVVALSLAGCMTRTPAPVSERAPVVAPQAAPTPPPSSGGAVAPREPDWRPQTYIVKRGETLHQIALDHGLDYRDLAAWNNIENANVIRVGQVLLLSPPGEGAPSGVVTAPLAGAPAAPPAAAESRLPSVLPPGVGRGNTATFKTEPRAVKLPYSEQALAQLQQAPVPPAPAPAATAVVPEARANIPSPVTPPAAAPAPVPLPAKPGSARVPEIDDERIDWVWPTAGKVLAGFSETSNLKGIDIAGKAGQPVIASAAGKVVYAGAGLRGYGKLIIVKHNNSFLSAYAHNKEILVKEGQQVARGQKIGEMGDTDADQVKLHFEIRRLGKPVDPAKYLPPA